MNYPRGSFDLRTFPPQQYTRFANSVDKGKNNMPPWGDLLQPADVEALWAYEMAYEFTFVMQPLKLQGATGSTVAPTAIR